MTMVSLLTVDHGGGDVVLRNPVSPKIDIQMSFHVSECSISVHFQSVQAHCVGNKGGSGLRRRPHD